MLSLEFDGLGRKKVVEPAYNDLQSGRYLETIDVELDKETGNTSVVITGKRDIYEEIQSFKDQCGFEAMKRAIATGQAVPADFADDGKHGQDCAGVADNVNDAYRDALNASEAAEEVKKGLDLKDEITMETVEEMVTEAIKKIQAKIQPATSEGESK